jgi:hypothetical protein
MAESRIDPRREAGNQRIDPTCGRLQFLQMPGGISAPPFMIGHDLKAFFQSGEKGLKDRVGIFHGANFLIHAPSVSQADPLFLAKSQVSSATMKNRLAVLRSATLPLVGCLALTGCSNLTPGENAAVAAAATGLAVGLPLALTGVNPAVTIPVTAGAAVLAGGGTYLIARNQASARQRKVAEDRARIYVARTGEYSKRSTRYIAVRTEDGGRAQGKAQVMIYDIHSGTVVENTVYDMNSVPPVGEMGDFGGYRARYIGTGA